MVARGDEAMPVPDTNGSGVLEGTVGLWGCALAGPAQSKKAIHASSDVNIVSSRADYPALVYFMNSNLKPWGCI